MNGNIFEVYEINSLDGTKPLKNLASTGDIVLLAGSAISLWAPTSIPTGQALTRDVAKLLAEQAGMPDKTNRIIEYIISTPFEYVNNQCPRTDVLAEVIPSLFYPKKPNAIHKAISKLVQKKVISSIVTTNYDNALEASFPKKLIKVIIHETDVKTTRSTSRILFKIHGSADPKNSASMVYQLSQEGEMAKWKSKFLRKLLHGNTLLVMGYSGFDFEICPEIISSRVKNVIWISRDLPEKISHNAERVLMEKRGTLLVGDLQDALLFLGSALKKQKPRFKDSNLGKILSRKLIKTELRFWACRVLSPPGYASYAEKMAKEVYDDSLPESIERGLSSFYLGDALYSEGRYLESAYYTKEASRIFLQNNRIDDFVFSEAKGVDALRCTGHINRARQRLAVARNTLASFNVGNSLQLSTKLDLQEILILREEYGRLEILSRYFPYFFKRKKREKADVAKTLLKSVAKVSAKYGQWHDLQQCKMWANRMAIDFSEVYKGSLKPAEDLFGWKQLGHKVPEMMAIRDALSKAGRKAVNKEEVLKQIKVAIDIGCNPEVWKLSLALYKHYPSIKFFFDWRWLVAFMRCQYSPMMRIIKLGFEQYR